MGGRGEGAGLFPYVCAAEKVSYKQAYPRIYMSTCLPPPAPCFVLTFFLLIHACHSDLHDVSPNYPLRPFSYISCRLLCTSCFMPSRISIHYSSPPDNHHHRRRGSRSKRRSRRDECPVLPTCPAYSAIFKVVRLDLPVFPLDSVGAKK